MNRLVYNFISNYSNLEVFFVNEANSGDNFSITGVPYGSSIFDFQFIETTTVETTKDGVVVLQYEDLLKMKDLGQSIETAFGYNGIGLLVVRGIPNITELRDKLLNLAPQYTALPDDIKEKTVHKKSNYSFGWSHGKEILKPGVFDEYKGSYYNNPQYDTPFSDAKMIEEFPESCHPNIWPVQDFPQLRDAFMELGQTIVNVGSLVAQQCDLYVQSKKPNYQPNTLKRIIDESLTCKARLLYYFPINEDQTERSRDSWCGWHNDHSSLTGLCPAMYFKVDEKGNVVLDKDIPCPDAAAGLYARSRNDEEVKVIIPKDCIAYQIGECSQVQTGGLLRATPHAVQAIKYPESQQVGRSTFAVFMQPNVDVVLNTPDATDQCSVGQYQPGMTFAEFSKVTIENYYSEK
ncbi:hypothetical protein PPL_04549 [Heterostelium album PN500]|uniref:Non-haem dioxygenase N-terminal domain-containing protein n=1 Tax=Heterostelium pallidum (strain ATCC 26659 / Pp 5 / PN500) TaxID=670386 RepID=D3B7W1_HETP5|nr:hypothetical protein PPL_04549 [Heterostelium album PN500]EFA82854.1 hypothetical protein PPL_04549 [Heterostelium album PN500]|eukprot:XP_020434971.1 hypothetical protein PPL_04549 [Heterostelium album PN500]